MARFSHLFPQNVEGRKEPAAAGLLLSRNPSGLHFHREGTLEAGTGSGNISQVGHVRLGQGRMEDLGLAVRIIRGAELG